MRTLTQDQLDAQASLNRAPLSHLVFRDVMLRWGLLTGSAYSTGYPDESNGDGIPQCQTDADVSSDTIYRAWCTTTNVITQEVPNPEDDGDWISSTVLSRAVSGSHRISVCGNLVFFALSGDIKYATGASGSTLTFKASAYAVAANCVALAAVSSSVVYMLVFQEQGDFEWLTLYRVTGSSIVECPHTIIVDEDYDEASLSWFDAVTIGGRDVIVLNEKAHGHPVTIYYEDGVWTFARSVLPQDIVDNYTFLRIGHLSVIQDSNGDDVIWATGRKGFGGSTGQNAQEYDVVLRSKDGEHWTADRYSYLGSPNLRAKLLEADDYLYRAGGASVYRARSTWLTGSDPDALALTVRDDILNWSYNQPRPGTACKGTAKLATDDGLYEPVEFDAIDQRWQNRDGDLAAHAGMWLWRYVGYDSEANEVLLSTEGVDTPPHDYEAGDRNFSITTRDIAMRLLRDWHSAQDWQWLSQQKHWDDCDIVDYLYSVGAAQISVSDALDADISATVDEDEVENEGEDEPNTGLKFQAYNKPGIFLTTKPFDARNFCVRHRFTYVNDSGGAPLGLGNSLALATEQGAISFQDTYQFVDTGQDFSDYQWFFLCAKSGGYYDGTLRYDYDNADGRWEMKCIVVVVHTDGAISWGYVGGLERITDTTGDTTTIDVYTQEVSNDTGATGSGYDYRGWNGAPIAGKTPDRYYVGWLPQHTRIGYGAGVVGCVTDKHNLVAVHFDMVGDWDKSSGLRNGTLMLLVRREHTITDGTKIGVWLPVAMEAVSFTPSQSELYEVEMVRDGRSITGRLVRRYESGGVAQHSQLKTVSYDWGHVDRMIVEDDGTDSCKVGILANLQVAESKVYVVRDRDIYITRAMTSHWPGGGTTPEDYSDNNATEDFVDSRYSYPWSSYYDFIEGTSLWIDGEEMELGQVTQSDLRGLYHFVNDYNELGTDPQRLICGDGAKYVPGWPSPNYWYDDGDGFAWTLKVLDGAGVGGIGKILDYQDETVGLDSWREFTLSNSNGTGSTISTDDYEKIRDILEAPYGESYIMPIPGFQVSRDRISGVPQNHPHNSIARSHYNDEIRIRGVWAYDGEFDKTLEWTLCDMAAKAGVLDFDVADSVYETAVSCPNFVSSSGPTWLQKNGADLYQRDFDLTITLPSNLVAGQALCLLLRASSTGAKFNSNVWAMGATAGVVLSYFVDATGPFLELQQTRSDSGTIATVDQVRLDNSMIGKRVRVVGFENHIAVYVDDCWAYTFHFDPTFPAYDDGYDEMLDGAGYVGLFAYGTTFDVTVEQPELWAWTDGKILDQRQCAVDGMQNAIGDRRVKYRGNADGSLKISTFDDRDDLGIVSDLIYRDTASPSDSITTHVRAVGEEIAEYVDHDRAALYGLTFGVVNTPSLDEEEAYAEAQRIVDDAISIIGGRNLEAAAQLDWETEDEIEVDYDPVDGGPTITGMYIVDDTSFQFEPGDLVMTASLREQNG